MKRLVRVTTRAGEGSPCKTYIHPDVIECRVTSGPERLLKITEALEDGRMCTIYPMSVVENVTDIQKEEKNGED